MRISRLHGLPVAALLLVACAGTPAGPARETATTVPRYTIEQFMDTERVTGASFSPDRSMVAFSSNRSGVFNVYAQRIAGGEATALTSSTDDAVYSLGFFPTDGRLLYTSDQGGNELNHVFVRELDGSVRDLTPGEKLKAAFHGFSADGTRFWISTNERDARFYDVYEHDAATYERRLLYRNDDGVFIGSVSPDGRYVSLSRVRLRNETDVLLFDRETGTTRVVASGDGNVANGPAAFSADSRVLYYTTDRDHEFDYLVRRDLATGTDSTVLKLQWGITGASRSRGGKYLVVGVNEDSRMTLRLLRESDYAEVPLPALPAGALTGLVFSADDSRLALYVNDSRNPNDLYVAELGGGPARPLTRALNAAIDPSHLVDGRVVRFTSYDGLTIPGVLYRPQGASAASKAPMLVMVHGGPGGQAMISYRGLVQYLLNHGYAIFDINNRGSSGYGKTFYAADDRCHGECDLGDVVAAKGFLTGLDWVDPARVGIIGGSYGGYMVAAALAFSPETFDAGVNIFGVTNWVRTLESIPPWWEAQRKALYAELGDPAVDGERLRRISPLFHAGNIKRPLIVLQGANDPRVLQVESDEIVEAVRRNGVPVEYVVFPDEGHGFVRRENEIQGYRAIREFLDRHLAGS
ncbi:MAG: prolyl oligopeptidase family serine peptidase [Steroidobacteraceae bacterium]|nr:prolyl oligopeptidase family serine peptidase [Steroidobacteraceae bacterium]